jgi:hypothetical protein
MSDRSKSIPPPEHLATPGPFRHAQLAFLPELQALAALRLGHFVFDLLFDSEEVRHDPVERVGGVVDDLDAAACALDEAATYAEMEPLRADLRRWAVSVARVKHEVVDAVVQHFPDETRGREAAALVRCWKRGDARPTS